MISTAAQVAPEEILAARFDGINDRISITPNNPLNLSLQDFTWYISTLIEENPNNTGTKCFVEQGISGTAMYISNEPRWRMGLGAGIANYVQSGNLVLPNYIWGGNSFNFDTKEVIGYSNGVEFQRKIVTVASGANSTATINIGARSGSTKAAFKGLAYRFRLHLNVILTAEEMEHASRGGDIQRGLFLDYDLSSPTLVDKMGNSTAAAFDGTTWVRDVINL